MVFGFDKICGRVGGKLKRQGVSLIFLVEVILYLWRQSLFNHHFKARIFFHMRLWYP